MKEQKQNTALEEVRKKLDEKISILGKKFYNELNDELKSCIAEKFIGLKIELDSKLLLEQIKFFFKGIFDYQCNFLPENSEANPFIKDISMLYGNKFLEKISLTNDNTTSKATWIIGSSKYPVTGDYETPISVNQENEDNYKSGYLKSEYYTVESFDNDTVLKILKGVEREELFDENLRKRLFFKSIINGIKQGVLKFCDGLYGLECYVIFNFNYDDYKEKFDYLSDLVLYYVEKYEEYFDEVKGDIKFEGFKISNNYDMSCFDEEELKNIFKKSEE